MKAILDSSALIAYLMGEAGGNVVETLLMDATNNCYAHSVNLCEVYYHFIRRSDEATAREAIQDVLSLGLIERPDMDRPFWEVVGSNKAR